MSNFAFCLAFLSCSFLHFTGVSSISYNRRAKTPQVDMYWFYEMGAEYVYFKIHSPYSTGWVGMGLNNKPTMTGADCVAAWIDESGEKHVEDRYATKEGEPIYDEHQDYELISAVKDKDGTTFEFKRKIKTCDRQDYKFTQGHTYVLFAFGDMYPTMIENGKYQMPFHGHDNHYVSREIIINTSGALDVDQEEPNDTTSTFDMEFSNFVIPQQKTIYWCQVFEIDEQYKKNPTYFLGWKPMITPGKEKYFHHAAVGQCRGNDEMWRERVKQGGFDCTTPEQFQEIVGCFPILITFVIGSPGEYFASDIATPFGEAVGGSDFLYFQAHFANDDLEQDVVASSKIRMYLTNKKRENIGGTLVSMSQVDYSVAIPPKQPNFQFSFYCPPTCTNLIPPEGLTMFAVLAHMHLTGRKMIVRHYDKNGVEKEPIYEDKNYIFDSQDSYMLPQRRKILPGDTIETICTFDTSERTETTLGGLSTIEEMCFAIMYVYPVQPSFSACASGFLKKEEAAFFGITDFDEKTGIVNAPNSLKGKTVQNVISSHKWTDDESKKFQEMSLSGKKAGACIGAGAKILGGFYTGPNVTQTYTRPKDDCPC